jgi:hypothetical protein
MGLAGFPEHFQDGPGERPTLNAKRHSALAAVRRHDLDRGAVGGLVSTVHCVTRGLQAQSALLISFSLTRVGFHPGWVTEQKMTRCVRRGSTRGPGDRAPCRPRSSDAILAGCAVHSDRRMDTAHLLPLDHGCPGGLSAECGQPDFRLSKDAGFWREVSFGLTTIVSTEAAVPPLPAVCAVA